MRELRPCLFYNFHIYGDFDADGPYGRFLGQVAVPVIEAVPYTVLIFGGTWAAVAVGIMNLILAVIVDSALEGRKKDNAFQFKIASIHEAYVKKVTPD